MERDWLDRIFSMPVAPLPRLPLPARMGAPILRTITESYRLVFRHGLMQGFLAGLCFATIVILGLSLRRKE